MEKIEQAIAVISTGSMLIEGALKLAEKIENIKEKEEMKVYIKQLHAAINQRDEVIRDLVSHIKKEVCK